MNRRKTNSGKPTIHDVAREAEVGVGTVSRVLNNSGYVKDQTKQRVLEAVAKLRFRRSRLAAGLARGVTNTIGVLVPFFSRNYFLEILRGIEHEVADRDYSMILYNVIQPQQVAGHLRFLARTRRVDGLIVVALSNRHIHEAYPDELPFPVVSIDAGATDGPSIAVDHKRGMYLSTHHLIEQGYKRIALIDRPQDPVFNVTTTARQEGYVDALKEAGLPSYGEYLIVAPYSLEGGYEAALSLLNLPNRPSAIACASDLQAFGVLRAVEEVGLRVGVDVAVTGYHEIELAQYFKLTTVRVQAYEMGQASVNMLLNILTKDSYEKIEHLCFSPELVIRETTTQKHAMDKKT